MTELEIKKGEDAGKDFGKIFSYLVAFVLFAALFMSIVIKDTIAIIAAPEFLSAWKVVPIIALSFVFKAVYQFFRMGMFFSSKTSYMNYIAFTGVATSLAANYLLVPIFQEIGASLAMLISSITIAATAFCVSQWLYKIKLEFIELLKIFFIGGLIFILYIIITIDSHFISIVVKMTSIPMLLLLARLLNVCNCKQFSFARFKAGQY